MVLLAMRHLIQLSYYIWELHLTLSHPILLPLIHSPTLNTAPLNWNRLKRNFLKGVVVFTASPRDGFRNIVFIKTLYLFLLLKVILLLPVFLRLHSEFWELVSGPSLKQVIFNFFELDLFGHSPIVQLAICFLIIICGLVFRPNYFISTLVFLVYFNFSRINIIINDGSDKVLNLLLFLTILLSNSPRLTSKNFKVLQTVLIRGGVILIKLQIIFIYFYPNISQIL